LNQEKFTGSVLLAQGGHILLSKGYGLADWDNNAGNTPDTRYYLGSVTKEFTATSILILQQNGKLSVKNSICDYIPNCPAAWQPVTLHHIMTHTSGIPEVDTSSLSPDSPSAWIASYDNVGLSFTPGSEYSYCSVCFQILAYVVEQVSGQPFDQFVEQNILQPLGMTNTGFDCDVYYAAGNHANGQASWQSSAMELGWDNLSPQWSFLFGSGLLYSTTEDLYKWDQSLYTHQILTQDSLDAAFTPYVTADLFPDSQYGYGWFISPTPIADHRLIWHDGVIDGFRTYIGRYVDDDITLIFLSNLASVDNYSVGQSVQQIIFANMK
jgi:CubicO group peptidase (beta-lactamase class C family)